MLVGGGRRFGIYFGRRHCLRHAAMRNPDFGGGELENWRSPCSCIQIMHISRRQLLPNPYRYHHHNWQRHARHQAPSSNSPKQTTPQNNSHGHPNRPLPPPLPLPRRGRLLRRQRHPLHNGRARYPPSLTPRPRTELTPPPSGVPPRTRILHPHPHHPQHHPQHALHAPPPPPPPPRIHPAPPRAPPHHATTTPPPSRPHLPRSDSVPPPRPPSHKDGGCGV